MRFKLHEKLSMTDEQRADKKRLRQPLTPPDNRWALAMNWHDLLFMHWPVCVDSLRPLIPSALAIDTFDNQAWLGVVPFRMTGVRPRYTPTLPLLSAFPELNVRTYVTANEKPGVWFFSLDAANPIAVRVARRAFHLPYFDAAMTVVNRNNEINYESLRTHKGAARASFRGCYKPGSDVFLSARGSLEYWLTERYCLYAANRRGRIFRGDIHHGRWPLQHAEAEIETNTMTEQLGFSLPRTKPLLHFAKRLDVVAWLLS